MRDRRIVRASTRSLGSTTSSNGQNYTSAASAESLGQQNQLLNACFEHATIGFSITDLEGRLLEVNAAYCAITGYTEAELRLTEDFKTLTHPDDVAPSLEQVRALKSGEIPAFTIEKRYLRK